MSNDLPIKYKSVTSTIEGLLHKYERGTLNLAPSFQRQSVWTDRDRKKLIDSIMRGYPLPAIFLYRRTREDGELMFDVIDGKQRLESVLMFIGKKRGTFAVKTQLPGSERDVLLRWSDLKRIKAQSRILGYELPVIEVDGELGDIIHLFVRINSTGKPLTPQEKRHAQFSHTPFLKEAAKLATKYKAFFQNNRILSAGQIDRMKHIELICELMLSLLKDDVLNKKAVLDRVMATPQSDNREILKAVGLVTCTLNRIKKMFPHLKTTRFRQITDFYTLAVLVGRYETLGLALTDKHRNTLAWELLKAFGTNVDQVRDRQRNIMSPGAGTEVYREYLRCVSQGTDEANSRRRRIAILESLLRSVFEAKDTKRAFSPEQRRILWNTAATQKCTHPNCDKILTWDDFTIDHINPHSKGGRSKLDNAAIMCRKHNASKGNRRRP